MKFLSTIFGLVKGGANYERGKPEESRQPNDPKSELTAGDANYGQVTGVVKRTLTPGPSRLECHLSEEEIRQLREPGIQMAILVLNQPPKNQAFYLLADSQRMPQAGDTVNLTLGRGQKANQFWLPIPEKNGTTSNAVRCYKVTEAHLA